MLPRLYKYEAIMWFTTPEGEVRNRTFTIRAATFANALKEAVSLAESYIINRDWKLTDMKVEEA